MNIRSTSALLSIAALLLTGCAALVSPDISREETRQGLEAASDEGTIDDFFVQAKKNATAEITTVDAINVVLRPHDRIYRPAGDGPFPTMLFFHGCSGPTASHEEDWAKFYNQKGVALIAVDSYAGRDIDWTDACNFKKMTPWERAGDVLATVSYARGLDFVDGEKLGITGFSHGAGTIWVTLVYASTKTPPINLRAWPEGGLDGVKLALPFYAGCTERWTVPIPTISFLAEDDRYIDEATCEKYAAANPDMAKYASHKIFAGATHTFDHSKPNPANIAAGSRFDAVATREAQRMIAASIEEHMR